MTLLKEEDLLNSTSSSKSDCHVALALWCLRWNLLVVAPLLDILFLPHAPLPGTVCVGESRTRRLSLVRPFAKCSLTCLKGARGRLTETRRAWRTWGSRHARNSCHSWGDLALHLDQFSHSWQGLDHLKQTKSRHMWTKCWLAEDTRPSQPSSLQTNTFGGDPWCRDEETPLVGVAFIEIKGRKSF